jgi:hypothetical protein
MQKRKEKHAQAFRDHQEAMAASHRVVETRAEMKKNGGELVPLSKTKVLRGLNGTLIGHVQVLPRQVSLRMRAWPYLLGR